MRRIAATMLLTVASATAQSQAVWPTPYDGTAGESAQAAPFTTSDEHAHRTARTVTTMTAESLPFGAGSVIQEIAFRHDAAFLANYGVASGFLYGWAGTVDDAMQPRGRRANQVLGARSVIFHGQVSLPNSPPPQSGSAANFDLVLPLRYAWTYAGGDMGIDLLFESEAASLWRVDAVDVDDSEQSTMQTFVAGCATTAGRVPYGWVEVDQAHAGGVLAFGLEGAPLPVGANALLLLGTAYATPIDLGAAGFPSGCTLAVHPLVTDLVTTGDASTRFARAWSVGLVPLTSAVAGHGFDAQWVVDDPAAGVSNPVVTSNAFHFVLGTTASTTVEFGRSMFSYGYREGRNHGLQLGPPNYVPILRFAGALVAP